MTIGELDLLWKRVLERIEPHINTQSFETWFEPSSLVSLKGKEVEVLVPNSFFAEWMKDHYYDFIQSAFEAELSSTDIKIQFVFREKKKEDEQKGPLLREVKKGNLNGRYTFDSFIVGPSNQFAHAVSKKVAEQPGKSYNPLFIYGGVGLGKTHLLCAIGNNVLLNTPSCPMAYLSAEQFTNEMIHSLRHKTIIDMKNKYRNLDLLLIDDIQFLSGKEATQEEFFHTFNALYELNKQIVISSDRPAKEIADIDERLRSRFDMGLVADIQPPDLEMRVAILRCKAELEKVSISNEVVLLLATHLKTNVRELEGALIRLGAFSSLTGKEITIDLARRVLIDTIHEKKMVVTIEEIQRVVSERFQVKVTELKSKRRTKSLVYPRQVGMYLSRELTNLSFPEIGKHFGGKDHSTVIHACKQIEQKKESDFNLKATLESLIQSFKEA